MREPGGAGRASKPFSLRWKLIILLLLLSLPLSAAFIYFLKLYLLQRYQDERHLVLTRYERQINGLIRQQRKHLEQVATVLPALANVRETLGRGELGAFQQQFDSFWSTFQIDMGLSGAFYVDAQGRMVASWGEVDEASIRAAPDWQNLFAQVRKEEGIISFLTCMESACVAHALAPILVEGRMRGLFTVTASLAETVLAFHHTAPADIAILAETLAPAAGKLGQRWGVRLEAASNRSRTQALLEGLADTWPLAQLCAQTRLYQAEGGVYEISAIALSEDNWTSGLHILVVEDVSLALREVDLAVQRSMLAALLFTALSMLSIYILLGRHLDHLVKTARAIPLLGRSEFARLRTLVKQPPHAKRFPDEIDLLDETALALCARLEHLEHEVAERTRSLHRALRQITLEKEFAANLLENAEVIIATADRSGCLLSLNHYGRSLIGCSESDVIGLPLLGSALFPEVTIDLHGRLHDLFAGRIRHLRHEATLNAHGENVPREISWVHTRLSGGRAGEAALLSVGLDIAERRRQERYLHYLQINDPLTDTLNRRGFQQALERMLDMAQRLRLQGALLYLDLDRFKYLNEIAGHPVGDELLIQVGHTLKAEFGGDGTLTEVGRLGGDEFAIATLNVDQARAGELAERIIQSLARIRMPDGLAYRAYRVSASVGIALFPAHGTDARELLVNADVAMYQAKSEKRPGWHCYAPEEKARERMHHWALWERRIKEGIANDHFILFFQPVVRLVDATVTHYEVLLRLRNSDGSLSTPGEFLDIAERSGLIGELDRWVVRHSLKKLAELSASDDKIALAINLSGSSIGDAHLLEDLHAMLTDSAVDPSRVIFEITETAAVADFNEARTFVDTLREWGCVLALDDFGSGFASFYYLKQFPVDCVKIDGAFIRHLPDNRDDQIFVRAMVEIARAYGKKTVAEFVENEAIVELLKAYGVDYAQGYHLGKPAADVRAACV